MTKTNITRYKCDWCGTGADLVTRGGFVIADVTDPGAIEVVGSAFVDGNNVQEVRVTPDGRFAVLNIQAIPEPEFFTSPDGISDCGACILVWNVENKAAPRLVSALPVELLGTHNMEFHEFSDGLYLFYVGQPLAGTNPDPAGNRVGIARFEEVEGSGMAFLVNVGSLLHDTTFDDGRSFPHDVSIAEHPLTGLTVGKPRLRRL